MRQRDDTWVVSNTVAPLCEVVAITGIGRDGTVRKIVVITSAAYRTMNRGVYTQRDRILFVIENGSIDLVLCHLYRAWILCMVITPSHETVSRIWRGCQCNTVEIVCHCTPRNKPSNAIICHSCHRILIFSEEGSEGGVLRQDNGSWVVGDTVVPLCEMVSIVRNSRDVCVIWVRVGARTCH